MIKTLLLNKPEVEELLDIHDVISAVEDAYRAFNAGRVDAEEM